MVHIQTFGHIPSLLFYLGRYFFSTLVKDRPVFKNVLELFREGDTLVIWKLDRLARSLKQLIFVIEEFKNRNIELISLSDNINNVSSI